ncbi:MAG: glycosyltransferase family 2 protein [Patescibacteria group bacterium]
MTKLSSLSIFFPCFNEEQNIPFFVEEAFKLLPKIAKKYEVIIVDDGSVDKTYQVAKKFKKIHSEIQVVRHKKNRGYGASLKSGFEAAKFDWVFFTDGDLQFNLGQIKKFLPYTSHGEVVIGYRKKRADGAFRTTNAQIYKMFVDVLFRLHVKDIDCAYKLFSKRALDLVTLESEGAFISAELLYKLKKKKIRFKQLPVDHFPRRFGSPSGNNIGVILKACKEAFRLYLHLKFGLFSV